MYNIAKDNPTILDLDNVSKPPSSRLSNADKDDMDEFKDNILFIMKNLGILDFVKYKNNYRDNVEVNISNTNFELTFSMNVSIKEDKSDLYVAKLEIVEDSYRLLQGSYLRKDIEKSNNSHNYVNLREKLRKDKYFVEEGNYYKLVKDVEFKSPSAAASVVRNTSLNGRKEWKLSSGKTLDDYENSY